MWTVRHWTGVFASVVFGFLQMNPVAIGADWPHWRGPNRTDIVAESSGWESGAWTSRRVLSGAVVWNTNAGQGSTSPLIVAGRLYTVGWSGGQDHVVCLDAITGKLIWKQSYKCPRYGRRATGDQGIYSGTSATPEFDRNTGYLYTLSLDGHLNCWNTKQQGQRVWGVNLYDEYAVKQRPQIGGKRKLRDYGYTTSPLVHNDTLIVEVGDDEGNLMGFDKQTGRRKWASQSKDPAGHSGGLVPITVEGVPCVAVLTVFNLLVARLDPGNEGKTVAEYSWATEFANNIPTPAVHENFVLVTSAYNKYAMCKLKITLAGATKVWEQDHASGVCSAIIHKGHVYWAWRGVHCLDFETGKQKWTGGKVGSAGSCILTADERLIVWADRGDLSLVETNGRAGGKYTELAKKTKVLARDAWPHVVLANGLLYLRDRDGNLKCLNLTNME